MKENNLEDINTLEETFLEKPLYTTLAPFISDYALDIHVNKHHAGYFHKLNTLVHLKNYKNIREVMEDYKNNALIYNNAAQVYNHNIFWKSMALNSEINEAFEFLNTKIDFNNEFLKVASEAFGSSWCWLTYSDDGKFNIFNTVQAQSPSINHKPILVLDLWEHAYYIDYEYKRFNFIEIFLYHLIDWSYVSSLLKSYGV
jgi:Fe-Mn family superoxide dismutase